MSMKAVHSAYWPVCLAIALTPLIGFFAPRAMAFWPSVWGLLGVGLCLWARAPLHLPKNTLIFVFGPLILGALGCLWSIDPANSLDRLKDMALVLLPLLLLLSLPGPQFQNDARGQIILFSAYALAGLLLILDLYGGMPVYHLIRGIPFETHVLPDKHNRAVAIFVLISPIVFRFLYQSTSRYKPVFLAGLSALFLAVVFGTNSQSAQLAAILMILAALLFSGHRPWGYLILFILLSVCIIGMPFIAPWVFDHLANNIAAMPFIGEGAGYGGARIEIWDYVSRYALQRPLLGHGIEASRIIDNFDSKEIFQNGTSILHPHNFALQLWLEFGLLGALLGCMACGYVIYRIFKNSLQIQRSTGFATFIGLLTFAGFAYGMWQSWWLGFIGLLVFAFRLRICHGACTSNEYKGS